MIVDASARKLFPLDMFPKLIQQVFFLTPLSYLSYAQSLLFLGSMLSSDLAGKSFALFLGNFLLFKFEILELGSQKI